MLALGAARAFVWRREPRKCARDSMGPLRSSNSDWNLIHSAVTGSSSAIVFRGQGTDRKEKQEGPVGVFSLTGRPAP